MLLIERPHTDPYFNLAAEEYFLKTLQEDCFMLWINNPSVIVGKHQNAFAEVNATYIRENGIPVIRRITGGGTVFHDPGNLNFSFISRGEKDKLVDFRKFTQPIIDYLVSLGVPARFEGKNDIRVNGLKVSGNAEHVYRDKVLHHGTLLYASGLGRLNEAIQGREEEFHDKAVRSVRSTVANLSELLPDPPSLETFRAGILNHIKKHVHDSRTVPVSPEQEAAISKLADEKYRTWEWNYGYSPRFSLVKSFRFRGHDVKLRIDVKNGIITQVAQEGMGVNLLPLHSLRGSRFDPIYLLNHFQDTLFSDILTMDEYRKLLTLLLD